MRKLFVTLLCISVTFVTQAAPPEEISAGCGSASDKTSSFVNESSPAPADTSSASFVNGDDECAVAEVAPEALKINGREPYRNRSGEVDLFMGVDFNYRDITFVRQYDLLVYLTPGVKWYFGNHWTAAARVLIPVINNYGDYYKKVRPDILTLSREFDIAGKFYMKASAGLFSNERYGIDLKLFYPVCKWLALEGQAGLTGFGSFATEPKFSYVKRVTGTFGGDIYLSRWNTQLRGVAGRFAYGDYGVLGEAMRHFNHCTVGLYAQWSDLGGINGGFKVTIMLPPYRRAHHRVNFRPASNFLFSHNIGADALSNKMYMTDPEQNDRDGWFSRDILGWGSHSMQSDYYVK